MDDEPAVCALIQDELRREGLHCTVATAPEYAIRLLDGKTFDLVITDICMPRIGGMDILVYARRKSPNCRVVLITGQGTRDLVAQALFLGAFDYLEKPFEAGELLAVVLRALHDEATLPALAGRAAAAMEFQGQAARVSLDSVLALVRAVEAKDANTRRHSEQVAHYATSIARAMGLLTRPIESIRIAALLHDVGKIGIPDHILTKAGPLTVEEFQHIYRHPALGAEILGTIGLFKAESLLVRHHHERWDGGGYPDGLAGEESPLGARIIQVADCIDAMLMERTYKKGYSVEKMLSELARCAGAQFDPKLAAAATAWGQSHPEALFLPGKTAPAYKEVA
ncbi:MAG: response regulator [Planctomycetota bacterium]|nr:response regulator [Planctomycetota bacterium]